MLAIASVLQSCTASHACSPCVFNHLHQDMFKGCSDSSLIGSWLQTECQGVYRGDSSIQDIPHTSALWFLLQGSTACVTHFSHLSHPPVKIVLSCHNSFSPDPIQLWPSSGWHKPKQCAPQASRMSKRSSYPAVAASTWLCKVLPEWVRVLSFNS